MSDTRKDRKKRQQEAGKAKAEHRVKERLAKRHQKINKKSHSEALGKLRYKKSDTPITRVIGRFDDHEKIVSLIEVLNRTKLLKLCTNEFKRGNNTCQELRALRELCRDVRRWKHDPIDWKCTSKNAWYQLRSLIDHICGKYPMPEWSYNMWSDGREAEVKYWIEMANGKNIRKIDHPYILTKRMAHLLMDAPRKCSFPHAIRWAQMRSFDINKGIIQEILNSRHMDDRDATNEDKEQFVLSFFEWVSNQAMLDPHEIVNIMDYVWYVKGQNRSYNMNGRTATSVLRASQQWHDEIARQQNAIAREMRRNGITSYDRNNPPPTLWIKRYQDWEYRDDKDKTIWTGTNIDNLKDLMQEGRALHHCVGSYASSCANGRSIIVSFKRNGQHMFTVEANGSRFSMMPDVRQKRASCNKKLTAEMESVLSRWIREVRYIPVKETE